MNLTANSFLVQLHVKKINEGVISKEDVPVLFNLKEEVYKLVP